MSRPVNTEDLEKLKVDLLEEIKKMLTTQPPVVPDGWLKSAQVRKLLNLSPNKLRALRYSGILPFAKVGRIIYFASADIEKLLSKRKPPATPSAMPIPSEDKTPLTHS